MDNRYLVGLLLTIIAFGVWRGIDYYTQEQSAGTTGNGTPSNVSSATPSPVDREQLAAVSKQILVALRAANLPFEAGEPNFSEGVWDPSDALYSVPLTIPVDDDGHPTTIGSLNVFATEADLKRAHASEAQLFQEKGVQPNQRIFTNGCAAILIHRRKPESEANEYGDVLRALDLESTPLAGIG